MAKKVTIKFLRGTYTEVISDTNVAGQPYFATDTKEVFISDGVTKYLVGRALVGVIGDRPAPSTSGRVYVSTDENNKLYVDTGSAWVASGITELSDMSGDLDDISDGSTYGKVLNTQLDGNRVKQLWAVTAGLAVDADSVYTHINDDGKHREINDSGTSTTELWSSYKIDQEIQAVQGGAVYVPKVLSYVNNTQAPPTENDGDRYILDDSVGGVHADWDGAAANDLVEYSLGTDEWVIKVVGADPNAEGTRCLVDDENQDRQLMNDGTPFWEERPTAIQNHDNLNGIDSGNIQHLTTQQKKEATQDAGTDGERGLMTNTDKTKLDGIEAGAEVNQTITSGDGIAGADAGSSGNITLSADYGANAQVQNVAIIGSNSNGSATELARVDHTHVLIEVDGGELP